MANLKDVIQTQQEQTPNVKNGEVFRKIMSATFSQTKYKNAKGEPAQVAVITVDRNGDGKLEKLHTTAGAVVQILNDYFVKDKHTEPLENVKVTEIRSQRGAMYLSLASSI